MCAIERKLFNLSTRKLNSLCGHKKQKGEEIVSYFEDYAKFENRKHPYKKEAKKQMLQKCPYCGELIFFREKGHAKNDGCDLKLLEKRRKEKETRKRKIS